MRKKPREQWRHWQQLSNISAFYISLVLFALAGATVWSIALAQGFYEEGWVKDVLVEAHGMLADIFVLGILAAILNLSIEKRQSLQRYNEEIEDFLGWKSDEAAHRIAGNIRRINKLDQVPKNLMNAYLVGMDLSGANLRGVNLYKANFTNANLDSANFSRANLKGANLKGTNLKSANLKGVNLSRANLNSAILDSANLNSANLENAILDSANLDSANLKGANLYSANLKSTDLKSAILNIAKLNSANLSSADLRGAYLYSTNLSSAIILSTNLKNSQGLTQQQLEKALLCNASLPSGIDMDPNRDRDKVAEVLHERHPYRFETLEDAEKYVRDNWE